MIERVRAAILHAERFGRDPAEAAVKAMREPTMEMLLAGATAQRNSYTAMIDAALV